MRLLALAQLGELLAVGSAIPPTEASVVPALIAMHAEWVFWVAERSEINANHFDANLAALAVAGEVLDGWHPRAAAWRNLAWRFAGPEVLAQFGVDGVNFEGAIGYHRLVAELFLLMAVVGRRRGRGLGRVAEERLRAAFRFLAIVQRPDGWLPVFGDNDSARVLSFDGRHTRDPGEGLALAAWYFSDLGCAPPSGYFAGVPWMGGVAAAVTREVRQGRGFRQSGIGVARGRAGYAVMDVAGVGLRGHGGHGHNDILSFEWSLGTDAVIVDPGQYTYTGDRATYDRYRASSVHNTIVVDGAEIAELRGPWRIGDEARPTNFDWKQQGDWVFITGSHQGYARLSDPVKLSRTLWFRPETGELVLEDEVAADGAHEVVRRFQFAPGWVVQLMDGGAMVTRDGHRIAIDWEWGVHGAVVMGAVCPSYGVEVPAPALVLSVRSEGTAVRRTGFRPVTSPL